MKEQSSQKPKEMLASSCCEAGSQLAWEPSVIDFIKTKQKNPTQTKIQPQTKEECDQVQTG